MADDLKNLRELLELMARLRGPEGCPWDRKQTPETLRPYIIEEAYEVVSAIGDGDTADIRDELGDLLLQVVFQCEISRERGQFDLEDVAGSIRDKLVRRHPHVFGGPEVKDAGEVTRNWERIKAEKEGKSPRDRHQGLPVLHRALRLQEEAARFGFDWEESSQLLDKLREETGEIEAALKGGDRDAVREEVGDLLFMAVNLARFLDIHPEEALEGSVGKFRRRIALMEAQARGSGRKLEEMGLPELEALWQEAKAVGKGVP